MRILVTGANGFIGSHVAAVLESAGHRVIRGVRGPEPLDRPDPHHETLACDFGHDTEVATWLGRLDGVDAVVNCVGILRANRRGNLDSVHRAAPVALFDACAQAGVAKVVQISAIGKAEDSEFVSSKHAADAHLATLDVDWVVVRPSLVYSPAGSYGSMSLIRALAALPLFLPVAGRGDQELQPIAVEDLAEVIAAAVASKTIRRTIIEAVGPDRLTIEAFLKTLRAWLGLGEAFVLRLPGWLVRLMVLAADMIARGPLGTTMQTMLARGNVGQQGAFETLAETSGVRPRSVREVLRSAPSHVQDRWHARLYFLRPALRIALALTWIGSGLAGLLHPLDQSARILIQTGIAGAATAPLVYGASGVNIVLGLAVLAQFHTRITGWLMFLSVTGYTFFLGIWMPALWFDPFGALIKNIVLFPAILVMIALEDQR